VHGRAALPPARTDPVALLPLLAAFSQPCNLPTFNLPTFFRRIPFLFNPFKKYSPLLQVFLDRDGTHQVTSVVIASHHFTQSVPCEGPRRASPFRHSDLPTFQPSIAHTFNRFSDLNPLAATLTNPPTSVANKRLTAKLTPVDATLTKNRGRGHCFPCAPSGSESESRLLALRPFDLFTFPLFHFPAISPRVFSIAYALFQVPYPVSPLLATLTKTAAWTPTIPILELERRTESPQLRPPAPVISTCLLGRT